MLKALDRDQGVAVAVAAGDSAVAGVEVVVVVVVDSVEVVGLGLAGATVSVFCSQAASRAAPARMQMILFIVVVESPYSGNRLFGARCLFGLVRLLLAPVRSRFKRARG